jgi:hypothetical protein
MTHPPLSQITQFYCCTGTKTDSAILRNDAEKNSKFRTFRSGQTRHNQRGTSWSGFNECHTGKTTDTNVRVAKTSPLLFLGGRIRQTRS